MMTAKTIVCLMGPTASGKTQLAAELIKQFPFEIVSVDSAMVYREMNIGTAKPTPEFLKEIPHRLIDFRDPSEPYSAAQFRDDALREINEIFSHSKVPLLVGGTMLYFRALQQGLADMPSADLELREKLRVQGIEEGWPKMHEQLAAVDPVAAQRIHAHDSQRIQRALEVYLLTGKSLTEWQTESQKSLHDFQMINIAIAPLDRAILHERIAKRFIQMLADGFVEEVEKLFARKDLSIETPAIRSVGYRQVWEYLQGKISFEEMKEKGIAATRQLAKRQLTWLRSWPNVQWFDSEDPELLKKVSDYLLSCRVD